MQFTNVITIDPSISCTGMCINGKLSCFSNKNKILTKKDIPTKWFSIVSSVASIHPLDVSTIIKKTTNFSESETIKLLKFDTITNEIIKHIIDNVNVNNKTLCIVEGFSYNSKNGAIIDLVTLSTLLRKKIIDLNIDLMIVSPSELKIGAAKLTYTPIDVGKRKPNLKWYNNENVAGGKFKKLEMYKSIIENQFLDDDWVKLLKRHKDEILSMNKIPTPINDINDAYLLYQSYMNNTI